MKLHDPSILARDPLLLQVWEQMGRPSGCCATGGYVRDRLLGRPIGDLDLVMERGEGHSGEPARRLAKKHGVRAHLFGTAPHRIWRIETATLKIEIWPLGGLSHKEDIKRRDFACNSLSWELPDGPLVDLVGGLGDLERGLLRTSSRSNLEDDPVRLLRAPRFLAQLETFTLDPTTRRWICELASSLALAPRSRVGQELATLLRGPLVSRGLHECMDLGLDRSLSPAGWPIERKWLTQHIEAADRLAQPNRHPLRGAMEAAGDAARLAFLVRAWGAPADGWLTPYAWPKSDRVNAFRAARLIDRALAAVDAPPADRRELAWKSKTGFPALIAFAAALQPDQTRWRRWWRQWKRNPAAFEKPHRLLGGGEIARISGVEPGPELGILAEELKRAQVRGEFRSRRGAARWLAARVSGSGSGSGSGSEQ